MSPEVYNAVIERDQFCVAYRMGFGWNIRCSGPPHVHHAVLRSQGGRDHPDDLLLLCEAHHHHAHNVDRAGAEASGVIRRVAAIRTF